MTHVTLWQIMAHVTAFHKDSSDCRDKLWLTWLLVVEKCDSRDFTVVNHGSRDYLSWQWLTWMLATANCDTWLWLTWLVTMTLVTHDKLWLTWLPATRTTHVTGHYCDSRDCLEVRYSIALRRLTLIEYGDTGSCLFAVDFRLPYQCVYRNDVHIFMPYVGFGRSFDTLTVIILQMVNQLWYTVLTLTCK
jgi:hypothetical protein